MKKIRYLLEKLFVKTFIKFSKRNSRKNIYKFISENIKKYCVSNTKILNIGSGGEIAQTLKKHKLEFIEIDIDSKRNPDYILSIENMNKIKSSSIDIIFCMEVLEHVQNPFNAVKEVKRVLKKGGKFIGSTPFMHPIHDEPFDFYRYTKYGILNLFKEFKCKEIKERNTYFESITVMLLRIYNVGTNKERIKSAALFPLILLQILINKILQLSISNKKSTTGYVYVFEKK